MPVLPLAVRAAHPLAGRLLRAVAAAAYTAWARSYQVDPRGDEVHTARTRDGWRLAVSRYRPRGATRRRHPVVLCHGLAASRVGFDLPGRSLAQHLADRGWDTWSVDLRGHGLSDAPTLFGERSFGWAFDHYLHQDVPAALDVVLGEAGAAEAHWLGHSMGGVLLYAHLASAAEPRIRSGVAVGSSLDYSGSPTEFRAVLEARGLVDLLPAVPLGQFAAATAPLAGRFENRLETFNAWAPNVEPELVRKLNASTFHAISTPVLQQLATALEEGGLRSADGKVRYMEGLPRAQVPVLALAGTQDRQCDPGAARVPIEALGTPDKELLVFGKEHGHPTEYGHFDLLIGRRAPAEVWSRIEAWLAAHD
jgi:pimeloyl-ACP methyl ester carboxylesterase